MKRILIVEDDRLLGKEINEELTEAGYEVFWARDSEEAFEALEAQGGVDLIFLDIMLPGEMDGYEILRRLRSQETYKNLPIVMLSNLGQTKEIDKAMEIGATDYAVKAALDIDQIVSLAQKYIQ